MCHTLQLRFSLLYFVQLHCAITFLSLVILNIHSFVDAVCTPNPCGVNTRCEVSARGAAMCLCLDGYDHLPDGNTIEGCPLRINSRRNNNVDVGGFQQRILSRPSQSSIGFRQQNFGSNPCSGNPCGIGAECTPVGDRPLCTCLPNHFGDPKVRCDIDPCDPTPCGTNAECTTSGSQAICKCPRGFNGDPFEFCSDDPCLELSCGINADCQFRNGRAQCMCRDGYDGDANRQCVLNPCLQSPCGVNAECERNGARAVCKCRKGYEGNARTQCRINPCYEFPCGSNADCVAQGSSAVCLCKEGYEGDARTGCHLNPCSTNPCGQNAICEGRGRSAVCKCDEGFSGNPYEFCKNDPCSRDICGRNAECQNVGNTARCVCPPGYVGKPEIECIFDPCGNNECGPNTECNAVGTRSVCRCRSGFSGSPRSRSGCRADPCSVPNVCGANAECTSVSGRPQCDCIPGHKGNPVEGCIRAECLSNSDCQRSQACRDFRCVNPCSFSCGSGADCEARNHVAICRCPQGYTGDPFQNCRRITRQEICQVCGTNTDCTVDQNNTPNCKCKRGYIGNPLVSCQHECEQDFECSPSQKCEDFQCVAACGRDACGIGANCVARSNRAECSCPKYFLGDPNSRCYTECTRHNECESNLACITFRCLNPCQEPDPNVCGRGANCEVKNHKAVCSCPRGHTGDPFQSCRPFTKADLCADNPCGSGAICQPGTDRTGSDRPVCTCQKGFRGDPLIACRRGDCDNDVDCGPTKACVNFYCEDPCNNACGVNADCRAQNHGAICSCPEGYVGDSLIACRKSRNGGAVATFTRNRFRGKRSFFTKRNQ